MIFKCPIFHFADVYASSLPSIPELPGTNPDFGNYWVPRSSLVEDEAVGRCGVAV